MSLAQISAIPQNEADLNSWSLSHASHHDDVIQAINRMQIAASTTRTQFTTYVLDPLDPKDSNTWLYSHQIMHNEMNQALGLSGFDLNSLDWNVEGSVADWIAKNADEHMRVGAILNLG